MNLQWIDSRDIAIELIELYPDVDPTQVRFTDLIEWIMALDGFDDDANHCNEKILEAVQMCWIDEKE